MEIRKVTIVGLGALGTLFGHHLANRMAKDDLRIVADRDRIERYRHDGIFSNGEKCDFHYVTPDEDCGPADLILVAVKFSGLDSAVESIRKHVGRDTIILSLLNGITSESIIGDVYGMDHMLLCVAQGMDAVKTGSRLKYANMGILCIGDRVPGIISEKTKSVAAFFDKKELPHQVATNMRKRLWGKFMLNVGVNQTAAVFNTGYGGLQKDGEPRDTMIAAMREVIRVSEAEGAGLTEEDLRYWLDVIRPLNPEGKPSLLQDTEARRPTEVALFAGTVIRLGEKYNIPTPVNAFLYRSILELESQY